MSRETVTRTESHSQTIAQPASGILQRKCACGQHTISGGDCEECSGKRESGQTRSFIQTKLMISNPGDKYEQEADRVAAQVILMTDNETRGISLSEKRVQRECDSCSDKEAPGYSPEVTPDIAGNIKNMHAGGELLPKGPLAFFESRFGRDFSQVRVHHDGKAGDAARSVGARAFTVGHHVVFGHGQFSPHTSEGSQLIAHELAHVLQQTAAKSKVESEQRHPSQTPVLGTAGSWLQRSLDTYFKAMNKKPDRDWATAAEHLNGESPKTIKERLAVLPKWMWVELHKAARTWPGICSNIARLTENEYLKHNPSTTTSEGACGKTATETVPEPKKRTVKDKPSSNLATYIKAINEKPPDWTLAAKHLNGENPKTIKTMLKKLPPGHRVNLHRGALPFPGPCSNIARLTEADFLKAEPGAHRPAREACKSSKAKEKPSYAGFFEHSALVETLITQIDNRMFSEAFELLDTLSETELSETLKELKGVAPAATMILGSNFEDTLALSINWERIMVALDAVEFTDKQRHVDNYMTCAVHPSSFGEGGALTLNITYYLTPDRALLLRASAISDDDPSGEELAAQSKTHVGDAGLLFPEKLNKGTVPKLWAAKQQIIREIEIQNLTFVIIAHFGAEAGLGAGQMAAGLIGKLAPVGGGGLSTSGSRARWTGTMGPKGTSGSGAAGGTGVKGAPAKTLASRADVLVSAYRAFRGRTGGLTGAEKNGLAKVRQFFKLPEAPTKTKKSIVGLLKIYDPDLEPIPLISQKEGGPAGGSSTGSVPRGPGSGFDRYSTGHIEGHAAGKMNDLKANRGVLLIEKDFCVQCAKNLPQMLPKGSELIVVTPDSTYIVRSSQL